MPLARPWLRRSALAATVLVVLSGSGGLLRSAVAQSEPAVTSWADARHEIAPAEGSAAFQSALATLVAGNHVDAYDAAKGLSDDAERRAIQWAAIYYGRGKVDYQSVLRFVADAPDYSEFKTRTEQSVLRLDPGPEEVIRVLGGAPPETVAGRMELAAAYKSTGEIDHATELVRALWTEEFLDRTTEGKVLSQFGDFLTADDHWARAVHLMMHDRASGTERLFPYLTEAQKTLAVARNATSRKSSDAKALLDAVDPSFQTHPVYLFSRAQRARQSGLWESAIDWLNQGPGDAPDADEWWNERLALIRQLLSAGNTDLAYRAAAEYVNGPEGRLVDASFQAGWIALSFLRDPLAAVEQFRAMAALSTLPASITQSHYWLGKALQAAGDTPSAEAAFQVAAAYGTTYYGLLARAALGLGAEVRAAPEWEDNVPAFDANSVVRSVRLLAANGQAQLAQPLLLNFAFELEDGGDMLLAARLAQSMGAHHVAIAIADAADRKGIPLDVFSFPHEGLPAEAQMAAIDKAAIYAIARQESNFQVDAVSYVGARGLMQLMPGTARETAAKVGVAYSPNRLTSDPAYNVLLGSTYLADQLERYRGSLVLAAAAYNAGAGNANKWIAAYGDPRSEMVDPVVWIELIPFSETRNYVKRVLGNYLVYRARLGDTTTTLYDALRSIPG